MYYPNRKKYKDMDFSTYLKIMNITDNKIYKISTDLIEPFYVLNLISDEYVVSNDGLIIGVVLKISDELHKLLLDNLFISNLNIPMLSPP